MKYQANITDAELNARVQISHHSKPCGGLWIRDINGPFAVYRHNRGDKQASWDDASAIARTFKILLGTWVNRYGLGRATNDLSDYCIRLARDLTEDPNNAEREYYRQRRDTPEFVEAMDELATGRDLGRRP